MDSDTREIIDSFISETYDLIEDAENKIGQLNQGSEDLEIINTIFRLFHSVKSSAGFLNFNTIQSVTHEAETLLTIFRKGELSPNPNHVDLLYETIDFLKRLIELVDQNSSDKGLEEEAEIFEQEIKDIIDTLQKDSTVNDLSESDLDIFDSGDLIALAEKMEAEEKAEKAKNTEDQDPDKLIKLALTEDDNSKFVKVFEDLDQIFKDIKESPSEITLKDKLLQKIQALKGYASLYAQTDFKLFLEKQENYIQNEEFNLAFVEKLEEELQFFALSYNKKPANSCDIAYCVKKIEKEDPKYLGEILEGMGVERDAVDKALDTQDKKLGELLVEMGAAKKEVVEKALEVQKKGGTTTNPLGTIKRKDIRVDKDKLDKLFNLVGELITAEAMVVNNKDLKGLKLPDFQKSASSLMKISREIQEVTMSMSMIALDGLFNKMRRLVRDLSRKIDKNAQLYVSGQDTEMDKSLIEQISDPLIHIIRNAFDHGLEEEEERIKKGKTNVGNIFLNARYEGNEIWISVKDDGQGLDREKILAKAIEKEIINHSGEHLKDEEVFQFIFEAGFSTAAKVSDISGRGVGMDVVKKNIEKLRGKIEIKSSKDIGTEIILRIPLTMAIIDGVTVRVGSGLYSIPTTDVIEFFRASKENITILSEQGEVVKLRNELLPLIRLNEVFKIKSNLVDQEQFVILVIQGAGKKACLLIDEILASQQLVIKSLSEYIGEVQGITGCSILANGEVSFIVDTSAVIQNWVD